jgi:cytosine/adenosine deaminase-related metal-dependent hydrolase
MFHEAIAPMRDRVDAAVASLVRFLDAPPAAHITPGLSPHAPYTVHQALLTTMVELSRQRRVPLAMHLAESREEIELLATGGGPFRAMLEAVNAWDASAEARFATVRQYLEPLAQAPRALVVHGNYLADDDLAFLADRRATISLVYCPRTHRFFGHAKYPLTKMLAAGVGVALGTDSRASNPDLSLLAEMRCVVEQHGVEPAAALRLGTLEGARALGIDDQQGSLTAGKLANLAVVQVDQQQNAEPHASLLAPTARVVATWIRGQPVWAAT